MRDTDLSYTEIFCEKKTIGEEWVGYIGVHAEFWIPKLPANTLERRRNIEEGIGVGVPRTSRKLVPTFIIRRKKYFYKLTQKTSFLWPRLSFLR